jgi:hypothetical protein
MAASTPSTRHELLKNMLKVGVDIRSDAVDGGHFAVEANGIVVATEVGESLEDDVVELGG